MSIATAQACVEAELLDQSDLRIADRLGELAGESAADVRLALALAVRWVRAGSTCLDLADARDRAAEVGLDLPEPVAWLAAVRSSPLVTAATAVLSVEFDLVYLARYHELEVGLCRDLAARSDDGPGVDGDLLDHDIARLFPAAGSAGDDPFDDQRRAVRAAVTRRTTVVTGGPGTGKTTTVARLLAALHSQAEAAGLPAPRVALTAPTGKAAARMRDAIADSTARFDGFAPAERAWLDALPAATMHRLLGWLPGNQTRFRHDRAHRLPHDVVVVDETSMGSLLLVARLVEALRPTARLILVGDADQLSSVEAGAVLRDVVDGWATPGTDSPVVRLTHSHRFDGAIGELAAAIRDGHADTAVDLLSSGDPHLHLIDPARLEDHVRATALERARDLVAAARSDDPQAAAAVLGRGRLLCGRRTGLTGAGYWNAQIERWLREEALIDVGPWFAGRPIIVNRNDPQLGRYNGDSGVVLNRDGSPVVDFGDGTAAVAPSRLDDIGSAYALTIHRSQGSQFEQVSVLLPAEDSRLMTRELLYTAVTRASSSVAVVATPAAVAAAIARRVRRSSGIALRLQSLPASGADSSF